MKLINKILLLLLLLLILILILNKFTNIKKSDNINVINNINLLKYNDIHIKKTRKIIISLTVIPTRFITNDFDKVINALSNQQIRPDLVLINICKKYNRNFNYDKDVYKNKLNTFESKYDNVELNWCEDYGPATKLFGFENYTNKKFDDEDIIIILDDDNLYNKMLTTYYLLSYDLYNCDGVCISRTNSYNCLLSEIENRIHDYYKNINIDKLVYNDYVIMQNMNNTSILNYADRSKIFGVLSWSVKIKHVYNYINISKSIIKINDELWKHDDLVFTLTFKKLKLNMCKLNLYMQNILKIGYLANPLWLDDFQNISYRTRMEYKYRNYYLNNNKKINYTDNYNIKILGKRIFAITVETPNKNKNIEIKDKINNQNIYMKLFLKNNKQTFFCKSNFDLYN